MDQLVVRLKGIALMRLLVRLIAGRGNKSLLGYLLLYINAKILYLEIILLV